jgi:hypothetical protein
MLNTLYPASLVAFDTLLLGLAFKTEKPARGAPKAEALTAPYIPALDIFRKNPLPKGSSFFSFTKISC